MNQNPNEMPPGVEQPPKSLRAQTRTVQFVLVAVFVCLALGRLGYNYLVDQRLEQSAAMFIGLPTLLGVVLSFVPLRGRDGRSYALRTGMISITLALLMSMVLLGEGAICVLMMSPLAYGIVGILCGFHQYQQNRDRDGRLQIVLALPLSLMAMEGVSEATSFDRQEEITVEHEVALEIAQVRERLAETPTFDGGLPTFLRLGFPQPQYVRGSGLEVGDRREIHYAGGEGQPGSLFLRVVESGEDHVRFEAIRDESHIAHWLNWQTIDIRFEEGVSANGEVMTRVRWTARFERLLDPAWYFRPLEREGVTQAIEYVHAELMH